MKLKLLYEQIKYAELQNILKKIMSDTVPKIYDKYRKVKPDVDASDYYICTQAFFTNTGMSISDFERLPGSEVKSDSGSRYKVIGDVLYRLSDHWGIVASCEWEIDYADEPKKVVGKVNISDMKPIDGPCRYVKSYPNAAEVVADARKKFESLKSQVNGVRNLTLIDWWLDRLNSIEKEWVNKN